LILLRLKGGLGNQLFQLGAAIRLAKNDISLIKFDRNYLAENQKFLLNKLFINTQLIFNSVENQEIEAMQSSIKKMYLISDTENGPLIDNSQLDLDIDFDKLNIVLDGEFQSENNILSLKNYIGSIYKTIDISKNKIEENNLIIHYPQINYLYQDMNLKLGLVKLDYIDRIISIYQNTLKKIVIYTDILGILNRYQNKKNITVFEEKDEVEIFKIFLFSNNLVIANSALSISAAYLSENINLLVRPNILSRQYINDELNFKHIENKYFYSNSFYC
jgi:hypothetical protein